MIRAIPCFWIVLVCLVLGACGSDAPETSDAPASRSDAAASEVDSTRALRQRLTYLESKRSFGADELQDELQKACLHPDPRVRVTAVRALGRLQDARAAELLAASLEDRNGDVVLEAAWALRQLQGLSRSQRHVVQGALMNQLDIRPMQEAWPFLEALGPHAGQETVGAISGFVAAGLLASAGSRARPAVSEGMAVLALAQLQVPATTRVLSSLGDLTNRAEPATWRIAAAFRAQPDSSYLSSAVSLLSHEHAYARAAGARAVGSLGMQEGREALVQSLTDYEWEVRASALSGLADLGGDEVVSYCAALLVDTHPLVREAALMALADLDAGKHIPLIAEKLDDPVPAVRLQALRVLAPLQKSLARAAFDELRNDEVDFVRSGALAVTPAVMESSEARRYLLQTLARGSVREQWMAAQTLGDLQQLGASREEVRSGLESSLGSSDFVVATLAAEALGKQEMASSYDTLLRSFDERHQTHNDVDVRLAIVGAVTAITEEHPSLRPDALRFFEACATDADGRVRFEAQKATARLNDLEEPEPPPVRAEPLTEAETTPDRYPAIDLGRVRVRITTRHGDVVVELHGDEYPRTVGSFLKLVDSGFHSNGVFHRVVPAFVIQGGCPRGDGWGDPGYTIPCEYGPLRYDREGIIGMAHAGRDTGGSQFFITHLPVPRLDGRYTAFGRVVEGMDVVDQIVRGDRFSIQRLSPP